MYISLDTEKHCDLLHDRPVLSTGRTPHVKQNRNCLDYSQNLVMSPGGAKCYDWRTDWLSFSCKVTLTLATSPWRWRQHGPPKRVYPTTSDDVTTQKTSTWIQKLSHHDIW